MSIFDLFLSLAIWGLIFWVLWWALGALGIPEPFNKVIRFILIIGAVYILIGVLTGHVAAFPFVSHW